MILAAGLGTRLGPLTHDLPKALVPVGGVPMLERTARRLVAAGADRLVINLHPFPDAVRAFVRERGDFGVEVAFSHEREAPLETGGGLFAARDLLRRDAPFFLHNVDVYTDLPLDTLYAAHVASGALATLAVMERETTRHLLFDDEGLRGRTDASQDLRIEVRPTRGVTRSLAFCGVHVIAPAFLDRITERGAFSILDPYLRLAGEGVRIARCHVGECAWVDVGRPEQLERAERLAGAGG